MPPTDEEFRVETRPATERDSAYIASTWLKSFTCKLTGPEYYERHRPVVNRLLARSTVTVAHPADDPETILGFSVTEPGVLHWVYVRAAFRGNGIARMLVPPDTRLFTHWAGIKRDGWIYYPYAAV